MKIIFGNFNFKSNLLLKSYPIADEVSLRKYLHFSHFSLSKNICIICNMHYCTYVDQIKDQSNAFICLFHRLLIANTGPRCGLKRFNNKPNRAYH
mgnify:CR=1 FL=1